jgi:N-acyl-D-aspartate/D-glutamate deacylase
MMAYDIDLLIRGGLVVDGTGAEPFEAYVAVWRGHADRLLRIDRKNFTSLLRNRATAVAVSDDVAG